MLLIHQLGDDVLQRESTILQILKCGMLFCYRAGTIRWHCVSQLVEYMGFETKGLESRRKVRVVTFTNNLKDLFRERHPPASVYTGPVCLEVLEGTAVFETITSREPLWASPASSRPRKQLLCLQGYLTQIIMGGMAASAQGGQERICSALFNSMRRIFIRSFPDLTAYWQVNQPSHIKGMAIKGLWEKSRRDDKGER